MVSLREVVLSDLKVFFEQQLDPTANFMAAFTFKDPSDRKTFMNHWRKIIEDESVQVQTILVNQEIAGHIEYFMLFGKPSIGYWIGKNYWGQGITTQAVNLFLPQIQKRPIYARVATDNIGSIRVLEKNGFTKIETDSGFAHARGMEIKEYVFILN